MKDMSKNKLDSWYLKKVNPTGAVSQIDSKMLEGRPVANVIKE